jgi:hypothetical protein
MALLARRPPPAGGSDVRVHPLRPRRGGEAGEEAQEEDQQQLQAGGRALALALAPPPSRGSVAGLAWRDLAPVLRRSLLGTLFYDLDARAPAAAAAVVAAMASGERDPATYAYRGVRLCDLFGTLAGTSLSPHGALLADDEDGRRRQVQLQVCAGYDPANDTFYFLRYERDGALTHPPPVAGDGQEREQEREREREQQAVVCPICYEELNPHHRLAGAAGIPLPYARRAAGDTAAAHSGSNAYALRVFNGARNAGGCFHDLHAHCYDALVRRTGPAPACGCGCPCPSCRGVAARRPRIAGCCARSGPGMYVQALHGRVVGYSEVRYAPAALSLRQRAYLALRCGVWAALEASTVREPDFERPSYDAAACLARVAGEEAPAGFVTYGKYTTAVHAMAAWSAAAPAPAPAKSSAGCRR